MSWSQRPALDGLRTIAVYLVVLYHCGISWLQGGFVGVDLFFVLSGFLVGSVLLDQLHGTGTIGLRRFYARRVRRLLPAALLVIVATCALFVVVASLPSRLPWVDDARGALLYVANWRFIHSESDYFAADINASPFLHFWSLAIEEQFYLVLPLLLLALHRLRRRWAAGTTVVLSVLVVAGIGAQVFWSIKDPTWAYYGTDARIYQLLLGVLAAWIWHSRVQVHLAGNVYRVPAPLTGGDRVRALVAWAMLALMIFSATTWLGLSASHRGLLAAGAAVLLIWAVTDEWSLWLNGLLSRTTMTYLGKISYGTYLWHWPVLLAFRALIDPAPWVMAVLVGVVATALAALSARLLEMPVRRPGWLDRVPGPTIAAGLTASVVAAVGLAPWLLQMDTKPALVASANAAAPGVEETGGTQTDRGRKVPTGIDWASFVNENGEDESACTDGGHRSACRVREGSGPHVMLIGDSHAQQIAATVADLATKKDFTFSTGIIAGCSWQWGLVSAEDRAALARCKPNRDELYEKVLSDWNVDVVILAQRERVESPEWHGLISTDGVTDDVDEANRVTIARTYDRLAELGIKVITVDTARTPVQEGMGDPLDCLATATYAAECAMPAAASSPIVDSMYRVDSMAHPDQKVISLNPLLCSEWPVCDPLVGDVPLWRDPKHYTSQAVKARTDEIWALFQQTGFFPEQ